MSSAATRLSFLFLDVFLGAFIIAIVLMVTLAKPPEDSVKVGGGTSRFLRIQVTWSPESVEMAPVLIYKDNSNIERNTLGSGTNRRQPAAPIEPSGSIYWPTYNHKTGAISDGTNVPHQGLFMAGFTLGQAPLMPNLDNGNRLTADLPPLDGEVGFLESGRRFAMLWVIDPEPGCWKFALAPLQAHLAQLDPVRDVEIGIDMQAQGYARNPTLEPQTLRLPWGQFSAAPATPDLSNAPCVDIPAPGK